MAQVGTPLVVVADLASLRITADIDERDAGRMHPGLDALVHADAFPGRQFPARVTEFTPQGDPTARVFRARLSLNPRSLLRPGMTVEINIILNRHDRAVLVPTNAVRNGVVWVVADHRARRRPVVSGVQDAQQIEIVSGARAGEQVIVNPPANLTDGARVSSRAAEGLR
jgi:RND family efflux transporter MFP subunit